MTVVEILSRAGSRPATMGGDPPCPPARVSAVGPLLDICDAIRSPVEFSCRSATCGTCRIEVEVGGDLLDPPGAEEREGLLQLRAPPGDRLACRAVVRPGEGLVRVRWVGGGPAPTA